MRRVAQREDIEHFITALGREATNPTRLYFAGGATAVLLGWRASTIDVDKDRDRVCLPGRLLYCLAVGPCYKTEDPILMREEKFYWR